MEKIEYFLLFLVLIILAIIGITVFNQQFKSEDLKFSEQELEKCISLYEGSKDGINIVFFGEDKKQAEDYVNYFFGFSPFDKYKDRFNFYFIDDYGPECDVYKGIALLCYPKEVVQKAGSCPNDFIVVLNSSFSSEIRSSSYLNVMSININHPMSVFVHEFGHSFVNLAEEYVPAKIPRNSAGNCVGNCKDFEGKNDGCFKECSLAEYSRSVDRGVMRSLFAEKYGSFNEWVVTNKINEYSHSRITGKAVEEVRNCEDEKYHLVEFSPLEGIVDDELVKGCGGDNGNGGFSYRVITDNEIIFSGRFNPELIFSDASGDEVGGEINGETFENRVSVFTDAPSSKRKEDIEGEILDKEVISAVLKVPKTPIAEEKNGKTPHILEIRNPEGERISYARLCDKINGDANGDGSADVSDVVYISDYFSGNNDLICKDNADVNGDGRVDLSDAEKLAKELFGSDGSYSPSPIVDISPSPSASVSPSAGPSPTASASPSDSALASPSASVSPSAGPSPTASASLSASASPATGVLSVGSSPNNANVYLNNDPTSIALTPANIDYLNPGTYSIKITKTGYYEYLASVNVYAGETSNIYTTLNPIPRPSPSTSPSPSASASQSASPLSYDGSKSFFDYITGWIAQLFG